MRIMVQAVIPTETANASIKDGTFMDKVQSVLEMIKPEAVYFSEIGGDRAAIMFVDVPDASHIPSVGEPLFLALNASVSLSPVMTPDDLMKAGPAFESAIQKFG